MRRLTYDTATLVREYTKKIKGDFPGISDEQISEICRYQFILTGREMEKGTLRNVRVQYLGAFYVPNSRVIGIRNKVKKLHQINKASDETLEYIEEICENFLDPDKFGKLITSKTPKRKISV